jgi:ubiquinone/menaquinone biosynthesis C-methylase UbiE
MSDESRITQEQKSQRSTSFGAAADAYERFRPGPPVALIEWMLVRHPATVVDLGAGTGALTKDLVGRVERVIAVEPDGRMRELLRRNLPTVTALPGTGEAIPLDDVSVDAVIASSSWHWMDPEQTLAECARIVRPGGTLGAVWTGPDPDGAFLSNAQNLMRQMSTSGAATLGGAESDTSVADTVTDAPNRIEAVLHVPDGSGFSQPEHSFLTWDVALTADELIGLLGTFSWIITLEEARKQYVFSEARRVLKDGLGVHGDVTVDVQYRSEAWRSYRL